MDREYIGGMIRHGVIPGMYTGSFNGLTQIRVRRHYNAAMMSVGTSIRIPSPYLVDALPAGALGFLMLVELAARGDPFPPAASLFPILVVAVALAFRRRQPLVAFGVIVGMVVLSLISAPYTGIAAIMVAAYSVGAHSRYRLASLGLMLATATGVDLVFHGGLPPIPDLAGPFVALVPLWMVGNAMRMRQLRIDVSEERAARLEREQELTTRAALAEERARIARDLHDVLAHSVSVMVVQAGAARQVLTTSPEEARQALLSVESTGRDAMTELRGLLDVLREDNALPLAPQPGMEDVDGLVRRVRAAGLPVELHVEGTRRPLPVGIDLAAYRIVQEALTNALKYSGLAATTVMLEYRVNELKLEVLDEGAAGESAQMPASGRGLLGMRDRVALYGGSFEAGPRPGRGYAVRVWLPVAGS